MDGPDLAKLKAMLRQVLARLGHSNTHAGLPAVFEKLDLREPAQDGSPSKNQRAMAVFAQVADGDLPALAERYLALFEVTPSERNAFQEILWKDAPGPKVPERYRREVARALTIDALRSRGLMDLLDRLWVFDSSDLIVHFFDPTPSLRGKIECHVLANPDYEPEEVFERLGAFAYTDVRFVAFLEGLCSHRFRPDTEAQRAMANAMNEALHDCGLELIHADDEGGYPVYRMITKGSGNAGRPKQVIFAPLGAKPDLRFRDAVNNDVQRESLRPVRRLRVQA